MKASIAAPAKGDLLRAWPHWDRLKTVLITLVVLVLIGSFILYLSHVHHQQKLDSLLVDVDRNYQLLPFDQLDAERYCRLSLERKYGDDLVRDYIDTHSSRMDAQAGLFKIFLFADVGSHNDYNREAVHCFVDPERRVLTHFRTISLQKKSLMSRATSFFK